MRILTLTFFSILYLSGYAQDHSKDYTLSVTTDKCQSCAIHGVSLTQLNKLRKSKELIRYKRLNGNTYLAVTARKGNRDNLYSATRIAEDIFEYPDQPLRAITVVSSDMQTFKNYLKRLNVEHAVVESHEKSNVVTLEFEDGKHIIDILESHLVTFIQPANRNAFEEAPNSFQNLNANKINYAHYQFPQFSGRGKTVSVKERRMDESDIDLKNRIITSPLADDVVSYHANQMATIIAGAGNSIPGSKGVAFESNVSSSSFSRLLPDDNSVLSGENVSVQNHSYGVGLENYYGAEARAYDVSVADAPKLLHVFSSGNAGQQTSTGAYASVQGFANITGNMKMAKNVLVVGAHNETFEVDNRISVGPAYDGRIKPDVIAFGVEGSSDAAAIASGVSLLLQDAYTAKHQVLPDIDLLKSAMVVTANDIGNEGPDYKSGYGVLNADHALQVIVKELHVSGEVSSGSERTFSVTIPADIKKLSAAINWIDPAANSGANVALINDLDFSITKSGAQWLPWILSSSPNVDSLQKAARRGLDRLNNTEMISIENPDAGVYQFRVKGFNVTGSQKFTISYWLDTADVFHWTFPTKQDPIESDKDFYFRWETTMNELATLEVSVNDGPYEEIANTINIADKFFRANLSQPGKAIAKVRFGSKIFYSDTFRINPDIRINVGFNCDDRVMLTWNKIESAQQYTLFTLGEEVMEPVFTTTDTVFVFDPSEYPSQYFSVTPVLNGKQGLRGTTYNYRVQGVQCYYKTFFADKNSEGNGRLTLELSTLFNIKDIVWEKRMGNAFEEIGKTFLPQTLFNEIVDSNLVPGTNEYRVRLILNDGTEVLTDTSIIYFGDESTYFVFPNPVNPVTEELKILTDGGPNLVMHFYDAAGRLVKSQEIVTSFMQFSLGPMKDGLYYYKITRMSKAVASGKLFIKN